MEFTKEQIIEAVKLRNEGMSNQELSTKFGIPAKRFSSIFTQLRKQGVKIKTVKQSSLKDAVKELIGSQE